jgi:HEPN domain-containing protein
MKQITNEWIEAASTDLESIGYLLQNERLTGHVAFHSQQAIEKVLKAIIEENGDRVPKVHSLSKLFSNCASLIDIQYEDDLVIALDSLYLESRYPGEFGLLPQGKPTLEQARQFYEFAKEIFQIVKNHLESKS